MSRPFVFACLITLLVACLAHAQTPNRVNAGLVVRDAFVRESPPGVDVSAAYFTLQNTGPQALTIVGIRTPAASMAMLHETSREGGMEKMRPRESLRVEPGATVVLRPGGLHVMLHGLRAPLKPGQSIELTLELADGNTVPLRAPVRPLGGS